MDIKEKKQSARTFDDIVTVHGARRETTNDEARDVVFGYLTRSLLRVVKTSRPKEKWETTRPPTSRSRELPAMLEMVFASRYVRDLVLRQR